MNIYFDTEFTGLHKNTTLISIGLESDDGLTFYAELNDYDKTQCNKWINENVISKLKYNDKKEYNNDNSFTPELKGDKNFIGTNLLKWISFVSRNETVQFVSDVCHYDFMLLIDLTSGTALNLPCNFSPSCHDINQDIARHYDISEKQAFNLSREELINSKEFNKTVSVDKHNAMWDALIIKRVADLVSKV